MKLYKFNKETLEYEPVKYVYNLGKILIAFSLLFTFLAVLAPKGTVEYINGEKTLNIKTADQFSEQKLVDEIKGLNLKNEKIVFAQLKLESGNFKSYKFRELNNLAGMKLAKNRPTTAVDEVNGFSVYPTWKHSLYDFGLYYSAYTKNLNRTQYLRYLQDHYAEDSLYTQKVLHIANSKRTEKLFKN